MSDKIKLLHKATTALWLELPESVARDFTDIQQAAIEELQARVEELEGVLDRKEAELKQANAVVEAVKELRPMDIAQGWIACSAKMHRIGQALAALETEQEFEKDIL